jgi:hypothetical protein
MDALQMSQHSLHALMSQLASVTLHEHKFDEGELNFMVSFVVDKSPSDKEEELRCAHAVALM